MRALSLRALGELARHVRLPREELSIVPVQEVSQYPLLRLMDLDELHSKLFPLRPADDRKLDRQRKRMTGEKHLKPKRLPLSDAHGTFDQTAGDREVENLSLPRLGARRQHDRESQA